MSRDSGSREFVTEPQELLEALRVARAQSYWRESSSTYRQSIITWIEKTKRRGTKLKRIESVVDHCVRGEQIPNHQSS
ncbi:MAG: YdeI/OmpD-associated family protein [Candidatus Poseidoniaceae archaeon]